MKKYLISLLSLFIFTSFAAAQDLAKANKLFEEKMYQGAVEAFEPLLNAKNKDTRYQAQIKTVLSLTNLYKYDAAAKAIYSYPLPSDTLWKVRYYMVKISALNNINRYNAPDLIESQDDPTKFTLNQLETAKKQAYKELWQMRKKLIVMPTEQSLQYLGNYYMPREQLVLTPTLFDFLVDKWNDFKTEPYAKILEEAYTLGGADREASAEIWHVKAIMEHVKENQIIEPLSYAAGYTTNYIAPKHLQKVIFQPKEVIAKAFAIWMVATRYQEQDEYKKAIDAADFCLKLRLNYFSDDCANVKESVMAQHFSISDMSFNVPAGEPAKITVQARNLDKFFVNVYELTSDDFMQKRRPSQIMPRKGTKQTQNDIKKAWTQNPYFTIEELTKKRKPARTLGVTINYPKQYELTKTDINLPYIKDGLFAVVFSKTQVPADGDIIEYLNFTDIAATTTAFSTAANKRRYNQFNVYTLNPKTGDIKPNIKIFAGNEALRTNAQGQVRIHIPGANGASSILAQNYGNYAIIESTYFHQYDQQKYQINLNSDRAIYRPGQEVQLQTNVIEYSAPNYTAYSGKNKLSLVIKDSSNKAIANTQLSLSEMGSAAYSFSLPKDIPLGNLQIQASLGTTKANTTSQYLSLTVEEYKKPDFEVILQAPQGVLAYNKAINVGGKAQYYFGNPVPKGTVKYTISKTYFTPWFCWWWPAVKENRQDAVEGTAKINKDGTFAINFTPKDEDNLGRPSRYIVDVFVTDEAGRTIKESRPFTISGQEMFFAMKMDKGFFRANRGNMVNAQMVNADEQPLQGPATAQIYTAKLKEDATQDIYRSSTQPLVNATEGALITSFEVKFNMDGPTPINLPSLEEGYYLLKLTAKDSQGKDNEGKLLFLTIDLKDPKIKLQQNTLVENKTYYPGETAVIIIGSDEVQANKYIEIYKDQYLIDQKTITKKGIAVLEVPIKLSSQGGINISWFSIYDYKGYNGNAEIEVPYINKKLDIKITAPEDNQPGSQANWDLMVKDANNRPVSGQAVVSVYDKALDYYAEHSLNMVNPYPSISLGSNPLTLSLTPKLHYQFGGIMLRSAMTKGIANEAAGMAYAVEADAAMPRSAKIHDGAKQQASPIRKNFKETAYFAPQLAIQDGLAKINFTLPDSLTQWAIAAIAFTKDLKTGKNTASIRTNKDLMLRLETPRFIRENDKVQLKTVLNNNTDITLPIMVDFTINLNGSDATALTGLKLKSAAVSLPARAQQVLTWDIDAPLGTGLFEVTAVARAGGLSDGEQKQFPLLPSMQRLMQSKTIALNEGANALALNDMQDDNIIVDAVHVQVDPTLLAPVLNAMPLLVSEPADTVLNLVNNYLPLAVFNKMYNKYPQLKQAADKLKSRKTVTAPWKANDSLLFKELAQTPWYTLSQGYATLKNTINIFDTNLVSSLQKQTLTNLAKYQNTDGGFAWIDGGKSNAYITLRVLESLSNAKNHDISIPEAMAKKAIEYIKQNIKLNKEPSYENITSNLYMAYILTSFPSTWYNIDINGLMGRIAQYNNTFTPLGKAYAAAVYHRLGDDIAAKIYMAMLFDSAKTDALTGTSWAPEERSWQWFSDSLTLHTAALKTLTEIHPSDPRIGSLVQWLVFNKKANQWGNSDAAAKAVYALVDVMDKRAAFSQVKTFNINWAGTTETLTAKPADLLDKTFTLSKYDEQATTNLFNAEVTLTTIDETTKAKADSIGDFASILALYTSKSQVKAAPEGVLNIQKQYYIVTDKAAKLLTDGATVAIGDEIQVRLTIKTNSSFDFVIVNDPKPAGFEADTLLSGWHWTDTLPRYEEQRDSFTNFFFDNIPNGAYELKYTIRPTAAGVFNVGAPIMQSAFAPEFATHGNSFTINVK